MGGPSYSPPPPPPPPAPAPAASEATAAEAEGERRRRTNLVNRRAAGREGTILTSGLGVSGSTMSGTKSTLGA